VRRAVHWRHGVGDVVVDGEGYSLYRYDKDTAVPSKTTCVEECAAKWPPVPAEEKITFRNLDPARIGTVTRPTAAGR
jgi:predicted lipoprotein with Yx(FWY)xxD motif